MPFTRLIAINANSGAFTPILATMAAHSVQIVEDGSVNPQQGIALQFPGDGYATTDTYPAGQAVTIEARPTGALGLPAQNGVGNFNSRPADAYCQARSATATGTTIRVIESED